MKIMVLAGGNDQAALIHELRNKFGDVEIILIDMAKDVIAAKYADRHIVESTMDLPKVKEIAINEKVDYIMTACGDQPLLTMAVVSEELGLPCYLSKAQALNLTNKKLMKRKMVEAGIPTAPFHTFTSLKNISDVGLNYPLIVKPVDSNGSKGVRKVMNIDELRFYAEQAFRFSLSHTVIVEEFIEGEEVSMDYYIKDRETIPVMKCLLNKYQVDDATQVIYQSIIPAPLSKSVVAKLDTIAGQIAKSFELNNTPLLIQALVRGEDVFVVEFSARLGGGAKYKTIQKVTGFNVLRANLESMMGEFPPIKIESTQKVYSRCHIYTHGGVFHKLEGVDSLLTDKIIEDYILTKQYGIQTQSPHSSSDRIASIFLTAEDYNALHKNVNIAISRLIVEDENGEDILFRKMYL